MLHYMGIYLLLSIQKMKNNILPSFLPLKIFFCSQKYISYFSSHVCYTLTP